MPVDDVNKTNPVLPAALQGRIQTPVSFASSLLNIVKNPVAVVIAAIQKLTPAQQATLLGSEALKILNREQTTPAQPRLATGANPDLTAIFDSQGLSPAQQGALATNETVQNIIADQNLTPAQQAALTVNQTLQTLSSPPVQPETVIPVAEAAASGQNLSPGGATTTRASGNVPVVEMSGANRAVPAAMSPQIQTPATETAVAREAMNPLQPATVQPIQYKNAFAVYEVRDPNPAPPEPMAIRQEVHSLLAIGRVRHVDPLVLKQAWEKRRRASRQEPAFQEDSTVSRPPLEERAIQQMIMQANEDLAASGVPLHLVLSKNEDTFVLDIYDCSSETKCQIVQEVPVDLDNLVTLLDNLEHEAGIIININT